MTIISKKVNLEDQEGWEGEPPRNRWQPLGGRRSQQLFKWISPAKVHQHGGDFISGKEASDHLYYMWYKHGPVRLWKCCGKAC